MTSFETDSIKNWFILEGYRKIHHEHWSKILKTLYVAEGGTIVIHRLVQEELV